LTDKKGVFVKQKSRKIKISGKPLDFFKECVILPQSTDTAPAGLTVFIFRNKLPYTVCGAELISVYTRQVKSHAAILERGNKFDHRKRIGKTGIYQIYIGIEHGFVLAYLVKQLFNVDNNALPSSFPQLRPLHQLAVRNIAVVRYKSRSVRRFLRGGPYRFSYHFLFVLSV
jgi:hypothetical protein